MTIGSSIDLSSCRTSCTTTGSLLAQDVGIPGGGWTFAEPARLDIFRASDAAGARVRNIV